MGQIEYRATWVEKPDANTLTHHGIKGMKWGVRRTPEQLGNDIPSGGGGGGFVDPDELGEEELEVIESVTEGDITKNNIARLVSGKPVMVSSVQPLSDGTKWVHKSTYQRDGNNVKAVYERTRIDANGKQLQHIRNTDTHKNILAKDPDKAGVYAERRVVANQTKKYARERYSSENQARQVAYLRKKAAEKRNPYNSDHQREVVDTLKRRRYQY